MEQRSSPALRLVLTFLLLVVPLACGISYTLEEESTLDTFIGNISADSGLKDQLGDERFRDLRYSILTGGNQNGALFKISSTTGILSVGSRIDREELCSFSNTCELNLEIAASTGSFVSNVRVKIVLTDINDNSPTFPRQAVSLSVSEAVSVNFSLSLDPATDLDASANYSVQRYSMVPDNVPFRIVKSENLVGVPQLSLVVSGQLDREVTARYTVTVWAHDAGDPPRSGSVSVTISVADVNDNEPAFSKPVYATNISESTPALMPILTVSATDRDEGPNAEIRYTISSQQPARDQQKLTIGALDGVVKLAMTLPVGTHRVLIEAQDRGSPPKVTQAVVEVAILDTDNSPPVLNLDLLAVMGNQPGFVPESAKPSTAVAYLAVSDPDTGANALVTCSSQSDHFDLQPLNLDQYKVILSTPLDRETTSYYQVSLSCHDGGSPRLTSSVTFDVWVVDVNDSPPVFLKSSYSASLAENNGPTDGLLQVAATDADAGNNANITYRLLGAEDKFVVGLTTGMIKANGQFDYEDTKQYVFFVLAVDQGAQPLTATATVTINVLDVNDEAPVFGAQSYNMSAWEGQDSGTVVGNVSASDRDSGLGGEVTLSIVNQPGFVLPFALSDDGVLTTTNRLDREVRGRYMFHVMARDKGRQPLSSTALVTVNVLDANDNDPVFVYPSGTNATEEILIPVDAQFVVGTVRAMDADADENGILKYSSVGGNASQFFRIEPNTGAIVTVRDLKDPQIGTYHLQVRATDHGSPPRFTDRLLILQVKRVGSEGLASSGTENNYVLIVVCIVVFTAVVAAGVVTTLCVLRKLDQDRKLKYSAACCPDGRATDMDMGGSLNSSTEYHQQVPSMNDGLNKPTSETQPNHYVGSEHKGEAGGFGLGGFPSQHRSSSLRSSQLQLPLSQVQHGRKTPVQQLDLVARRADDFHSTSSTETTTGDSGHGSDEDLPHLHHLHNHLHHLNHSADRLSPAHLLRLGGGTTPTAVSVYNHHKDSASSGISSYSPHKNSSSSGVSSFHPHKDPMSSSRPIFIQDGQFKRSKPRSSVRFSTDVTFESVDSAPQTPRGRFASQDSVRDDDSDLNTTTSGSYSVAPDDQFADFRHLDFTHYSNGVGRYGGPSSDMVV